MPISSTLPDDPEALKPLVLQLRDTVSTLEQALSIRSLEIEQLKHQAQHRDNHFIFIDKR